MNSEYLGDKTMLVVLLLAVLLFVFLAVDELLLLLAANACITGSSEVGELKSNDSRDLYLFEHLKNMLFSFFFQSTADSATPYLG